MASARRLPQAEFVALMAMLSATVAFSIDAMLPALPEIAAELTPEAPNRAQLIITSFVLGMGAGTFFAGPLSDTIGRRKVMVGGAVLYVLAALWARAAESLETVLLARVLQGIGAAGPRVISLAMIRDLYSGREMARIVSFVMVVFAIVPAIGPALGAGIIALDSWRGIFLAFTGFALVSAVWLMLRQPETLAVGDRRPLRPAHLREALRDVLRHPTVRRAILVQTLVFGMLFSCLSVAQPIFDETFGEGDRFPLWFALIALVSGTAGLVNARLVVRTGMRAMIRAALVGYIVLTLTMIAAWLLVDSEAIRFWVFVIWTTGVFFQTGLTLGNLNALGLEPMGHIAGMAASMMSAIATAGAVVIAVPIGLSFDGTPLPVALGMLASAVLALWITLGIERDTG